MTLQTALWIALGAPIALLTLLTAIHILWNRIQHIAAQHLEHLITEALSAPLQPAYSDLDAEYRHLCATTEETP